MVQARSGRGFGFVGRAAGMPPDTAGKMPAITDRWQCPVVPRYKWSLLLLWTSPVNFNNSKTAFAFKAATKLMGYKIARYGWLPDLPDQRDHFYAAPVELAGVLPAKVDLRPQCPPVYDQGQLGSCTANAIAGAIEFDRMKQKQSDFHAVAPVHLLQRTRHRTHD
jgi:hypothetical protein